MGQQGEQGSQGLPGKDGKDGSVVTIGADGYWYIDGVKTNTPARGVDGNPGSVVTIGNDNYWYIDGVRTSILALGRDGQPGTPGTAGTVITIGPDGYWYIDGNKTNTLAVGTNGVAGSVVTIGSDNYWYIDGVKTETKALGESGKDGTVVTIGADSYWYIDGEKTTVQAQGLDGQPGTAGTVVTIGSDGYWYIDDEKTTVRAQGLDGQPGTIGSIVTIGANGNWYIDGTDTGHKAQGPQGEPGNDGSVITIGANGNWYIDGTDTGKKAIGENGTIGSIVTIGDNGNWYIDGEDTGHKAQGPQGEQGPTGPQGEPGEDGVYLVTFRANGGVFSDNKNTLVLPASGGIVNQPESITRQGYSFGGWHTDEACTNSWDFTSDTVTGHITLYAKWNLTEYTVSFDADGGTPEPENQTITEGGKVNLPSAMIKANYIFGGWYSDAGFINIWDFNTDTVTDNITLYAKWNPEQCTINFDADGGTPVPAQRIVAYGTLLTQPINMSKTGYTFGGWYSDEDFTTQWDFAEDIVTGNITLYAKWGYPVLFNANGGTPAPAQQVVVPGGKITEPSTMTFGGRSFIGWYKEPAFTTLWDFNNDTVNGSTPLYACWDFALPLTDVADVAAYLTQTPANPVYLAMAFDLGDMTSANSGWQALLSAIQTANKYVDLDLSDCTMTGTEFNPDRTVTTGKIFITSIVLPNMAESITDGTSIATSAFASFTRLLTVSAANVTSVGDYAFADRTNLASVDFPVAISIGDNAFSDCSSLTSVIFPVAISIGNGAFYACSSLISVNFPEATSIGDIAFQICSNLTDVSFPVAISIGDGAFSGCSSLTSVDFPVATSIGIMAFSGSSLTRVNFPVTTSIGEEAFGNCSNLTDVSFPVATSIGDWAFWNCSSLTSVNFPEAISIGNNAFQSCDELTSMNIPAVMSIGNGAFHSIGNKSLTITMGSFAPIVGISMFGSSSYSKTVTVKVPANASGYGVIPDTYHNFSVGDNWGNAFRGLGWDGLNYLNGTVNYGITLTIEYQ